MRRDLNTCGLVLMRRDLNTCSSRTAMHAGWVRVRILFRRSTNRNDNSIHVGIMVHFLVLFRKIRKEKKTHRAGPAAVIALQHQQQPQQKQASSSSSSSSRSRRHSNSSKRKRCVSWTHELNLLQYVDIPTLLRRNLLKTRKLHLRPSISPLPNRRPTELLVTGATTTISTAEPLRPPISRASLTVSLAACVRDTAQMVHVRSA